MLTAERHAIFRQEFVVHATGYILADEDKYQYWEGQR